MLSLEIPSNELYIDRTNEFLFVKGGTLNLEHSLLAISKWESKWKKPYLSNEVKTKDENIDYVKCMTINSNEIDPNVYFCLNTTDWGKIINYINDPATATQIYTYTRNKTRSSNHIYTSEEIYAYMAMYGIPFGDAEKWNLNRLLILINVCAVKNSSGDNKMSKGDRLRQQRELNEQRIAKMRANKR